jgi:hypothetical protein
MPDSIQIKVTLDKSEFDRDVEELKMTMADIRPQCWCCRFVAAVKFFFRRYK